MAGNLTFNVDANDQASSTFAAVAAELKQLGRELDKIDGRNVKAKVTINTPSAGVIARLDQLRAAVADIDGRNAKARVEITGEPTAAQVRSLRAAAKALRELDGANATATVGIVGDLPDAKALRAAARALKQLQDIGHVAIHISITGAVEALAQVAALRTALRGLPGRVDTRVKVDTDKTALGRIKALGSALAGAASGLTGLAKPMLILGAASGAVQTIGGVVGALQQLAPVALAAPGIILGVASAYATLKIGMSGVGDAIKSGDLSGLAPSAAAAVTAIRGLKSGYDDLKKSVQGALFKDFAADISKVGKDLLPTLKTGLTDIATQLNVVGRESLKAMQSPFFKDDLTQIFGNTASMFREIGSGVGDLMSGIVGLGGVGSTYLPALGTAIGNVANKFKQWVNSGVEDGSIKRMIDGAIQGFRDLGGVISNLGSIAGSIFSGLGGAVSSPLASLRELTGALAEFFASAQAQGPLKALGDTLAVVGGVVKDVLIAGLQAVAPLLEKLAPIAQALASVVGDVLVSAFMQLSGPIGRLIDRLEPVLVPALKSIGTILTTMVIPALASFVDWLAGPGFDTAAVGFQVFAIKATEALQVVLSLLSGFTGAMADTFRAFSWLPGVGAMFGKVADGLDGAKRNIDGFNKTLDGVKTQQLQLLDATLQSIADRDITLKIKGDLNGVTGAVEAAVTFADGSTGTVKLDGDPHMVNGKVQQAVTFGNGQTAIITIDGVPDPATGKVNAIVDYGNGQTARVQIDAEATKAVGVLEAWKAIANGSFGIPQLDSNPALANSVLQLWKSTSDATTGLPTIDANSGKAQGVLNAWKALSDGTTGIPELDSNPALANAILQAWKARSDATTGLPKVIPQVQSGAAEAQLANLARTRYTQIIATVVAGQSGAVPTATGVKRIAGGAIGGIVHPYADGAVVEHYADGGIRPLRPMRGDIAQRVPANSWRVIGDRPKGLEYFLPDDSTPRSMKIGAEWAKNRGMMLVPRPAGMATGGIRAEDGSTVGAGFYSAVSPQLRAKQDGRGIGAGEIASATWASLLTKGWRAVGSRLYYPGTGPAAMKPAPAARPTAVQRPTAATGVNFGPLIAEFRAQLGELRALRADVVGGGGHDAAIAANTAQIAANTRPSSSPADRAQSARYRSALGALA